MTFSVNMMVDATHANVDKLPTDLGAVAGYVTGTPDICWSSSDWQRFPHSAQLRIDQADYVKLSKLEANIGDVESGTGTIAQFGHSAETRKKLNHITGLYCSYSNYSSYRNFLEHALGLRGWIRYWVANWSWSLQEAINFMESDPDEMVVAVQWASPSSNPNTHVPATSLTLSEVQCDLSVKMERYFPAPFPYSTIYTEH